MHYLNLGCGERYHPDWININFTSTGEGVIAHNLKHGIPFADESFDIVYNSHVLEHFPKPEAKIFITECYRVLRPQGVLRVVVPDLEQIARMYLYSLDKVNNGCSEWTDNYQWILLEMYDQTVRNYSGGEMAAYLFKESICNEKFILERIGTEGKNLIEAGRQYRQNLQSQPLSKDKIKPALKQIYRFICNSEYRRETLLKLLLGKEYESLKIGRFRQGGEVHQWMYDRYSLSSLLEKCGFQNVSQQTAYTSNIPNWTNFHLDTELDGTVYKPDSLFMEAIKL